MKVLVLGVTGMLGSAMYRVLSRSDGYEVWGTMRGDAGKRHFSTDSQCRLVSGVDVLDQNSLVSVLNKARPDVVINCVGLIKQLAVANDPLYALPINAMLPHRLARLCDLLDARLIHISTDCVFSGSKGMYKEEEASDASDLYGMSKYIGEVKNQSNSITLRTSIIGHELGSQFALIDWFLAQEGVTKGYVKAIFSGLPTVELSALIRDYVLPQSNLTGLYNVSSEPIDKFSLLKLVAATYHKEIKIIPSEDVQIDRSLDSTRFRKVTGYVPPAWTELVKRMYQER